MPNTHRRRRRDATKQFRRVGVGGVYWALVSLRVHSFSDSNWSSMHGITAHRHNTETAVTTLYLSLAADSGQCLLCLLDLTVAFDTDDHDLLLPRLESQVWSSQNCPV